MSDSIEKTPETRLAVVCRRLWFGLVLLGLVWGVVTGASFFGGVGVDSGTALFGWLATIGLAVTLWVAQKDAASGKK